jgi:putative acyl-CoA dehydrogenase
MCLDVLRAIARVPNAAEALRAEFLGIDEPRFTAFATRFIDRLASPERNDERQARALTRDLVLALQGALLIKHAPSAVADAFCASRFGGETSAFGLLPRGLDLRAIVERAASSEKAG